jgi:hypothetical protein
MFLLYSNSLFIDKNKLSTHSNGPFHTFRRTGQPSPLPTGRQANPSPALEGGARMKTASLRSQFRAYRLNAGFFLLSLKSKGRQSRLSGTTYTPRYRGVCVLGRERREGGTGFANLCPSLSQKEKTSSVFWFPAYRWDDNCSFWFLDSIS